MPILSKKKQSITKPRNGQFKASKTSGFLASRASVDGEPEEVSTSDLLSFCLLREPEQILRFDITEDETGSQIKGSLRLLANFN